MSEQQSITGTSAVNAEGKVMIFCEEVGFRFNRYSLAGREIALFNDDKDYSLSRTYGKLTVEALESGADLYVHTINSDGSEGDFYKLGGLHGL